jgi:hypothetical protein
MRAIGKKIMEVSEKLGNLFKEDTEITINSLME